MIIPIHQVNPEKRKIKQISDDLLEGEVFIFPTDTVYALVADSNSVKAIEKLFSLKKTISEQPLTLLCKDISSVSNYILQLSDQAFKLMKKITPGPFIFLFKANKNIPRISLTNEKTKKIGIRIPDNQFLLELLKVHPNPIITTSVVLDSEFIEEPEKLENIFGKKVKAIIDGGFLITELATIIDFTSDEMMIVREGKGIEKINENY